MKTASQLLREAEGLKSRLSLCPSLVGNNEAWAVQQQLQTIHGQLLVGWLEVALDNGVERDLWNIGFRNTITQLQQHTRDKQGGSSENRDLLAWFLNSASGFYLQLFNQICSAYNLDLPFRRKDSIYGAFDLGSQHYEKVKASSRKNALYLCQYCLVHLGDLARYRHQAKQAETFYRHAVVVSPSSGHPYNQLALLEAGRGNRLAAVALYVRAMCVPCPFPGAPANLTQTLTKVTSNSTQEISGSSRVTGDEYTSIFLQFHARLYLHHDLESARASLPILQSALSTLVATNAFTRTSLQQMVIVNLFSIYCFSGRLKCKGEDIKKEDEIIENPTEEKENVECVHLVEELSVGVLAALLLPVHTIKDPEQLMTYPAIPAVRLLFEWVRCEPDLLGSEAMRSKQQIWPGLCKIVNDLQPQLNDFNTSKYSELPLPEDWELQGFEPLQKMLSRYKYREGLSKASPDEYNLIRASRLQDLAKWFVEQNVDGNAVIKVNVHGDSGVNGGTQHRMFEPMQHLSPPPEEVRALEQLSLHPGPPPKNHDFGSSGCKGKVGILKPQGSLERSRETRDQDQQPQGEQQNTTPTVTIEINDRDASSHANSGGLGLHQQQGPNQSRTPRTRTNVALQAIMKRNSAMQEAKQVTFKTPSPAISPNPSEASSDSHRSQLSTPPLLLSSNSPRGEAATTSPMPPPQQQHIPPHGFPGSFYNNQQHVNEGQYLRQQQPFTGQQTWPAAGNTQSKPRPPSQQQNQNQNNHPISSVLNPPGLMFNPLGNLGVSGNMGAGPPLVQQLRPNIPHGPSDQLLSGLHQRPPPPRIEGFAQMPPPPMIDSTSRMREPGPPQVLDMMGMTRPPPIISGMEGFCVTGPGPRSLDEQLQQHKKQHHLLQQQQFKNLPRLPQGAQLPFLSLSGHQDIENPNNMMSNLQMKSQSGSGSFNLEQMGNMNSNRSMHQMDSDNPQVSVGPHLSGPPPPLTAMWGSGSPGNQFDSSKGFTMAPPNLASLLQQQQQHQQQQQQQQQQQHGSGNMVAHPVDVSSGGDGGLAHSRPPPVHVSSAIPSSVAGHSGAVHQQPSLHTSSPRSPPGYNRGPGLPTLPPGGLPTMTPLGLLSLTSHPPPPISNMNINQNQRMLQSFRTEGLDSESSIGSTYSLFSPMSGSSAGGLGGSGLGSGGLSGMGAGPRNNVPHPLYPTTSQPPPQTIGQSLWSGPGPSPLERLLEQKKYSSVPK